MRTNTQPDRSGRISRRSAPQRAVHRHNIFSRRISRLYWCLRLPTFITLSAVTYDGGSIGWCEIAVIWEIGSIVGNVVRV